MQLLTEELEPVVEAEPSAVAQILASDSFGSFAILEVSASEILQAGNNWDASPECEQFLRAHGSDPWILEYGDPESGLLIRAKGDQTLARVSEVFLAFLAGDRTWLTWFEWSQVDF